MAFALAADMMPNRPEVVAFSHYRGIQYASALNTQFDVIRRNIESVRFGQTTYPLRHPLTGVFFPRYRLGKNQFSVEGFQTVLLGEGASPREAYEDWVEQFHAAFQRLYVMQPFEMEAEDTRLWNIMGKVVNVEQYRLSQPLVVLQYGKVAKTRPFPEVIRWEDGTRERVHLSRMPAEFVNYKSGQPFEALVHRHPVTHRIIKVEYVKRRTADRTHDLEKAKRLWDSIPSSSSLPDTDWD